MADNARWTAQTARAGDVAGIDQGLRTYMLRVYNYMTAGLAITGLVAWIVSQSPALLSTIHGTPLKWVVMLAPIGVVLLFSMRLHKMSAASAQLVYWGFAGLMGLSISYIFAAYTDASIARVFFITAGTFAATSLYGYTTKRDLSKFGSFLMMGLIGVILASVVNIFLGSDMLSFAISIIGVIVFVGLTAYDTQRIKETYDVVSHDGQMMQKTAIFGALQLYLSFLNLFMLLLNLLGNRE
jgi:FtsH-binding integral membrane protein